MAVKRNIKMAGALWFAAACAPEPAQINPGQLLARASLDLRGVRPTPEEIQAVEDDPSLIDSFIDQYLADARFGDRVVSVFGDIYRTRLDGFDLEASDFNIGPQPGFENPEQAFVDSVGEESLRRLAFIAVNDRPYGELVTADYTMSNEILAQVLPVDYPANGTGWLQARYLDGRPTAGILTDSTFWWRYNSTFVNANRGRANAISRILLCQDYLAQPIRFERINLLNDNEIRNAIKFNAGCQGCHVSLDPLAAHLWGFFYDDIQNPLDAVFYHPEQELFWEFTNERHPGYFGTQTQNLTDLGRQLAQDPQLVQCATQQVYSALLARPTNFDDTQSLNEHREVFVDSGAKLKDLYRSVMRSPEYRTDGINDPRFTTIKSMTVDQIASSVEDLTGFALIREDDKFNLMRRSNDGGLRTLFGGADGFFVTQPSTDPTVTQALAMARLAEAASAFVVANDATIADPAARRLFKDISTLDGAADDATLRAQMQALRLRILSQRVDANSPEVDDDVLLWQEIFALQSDSRTAWAGVVAALLRDPSFMLY